MKPEEMKNLKPLDLITWGICEDQGLVEEVTESGIKVLWEDDQPDLRWNEIPWDKHWIIETVTATCATEISHRTGRIEAVDGEAVVLLKEAS